MRATIYLHPHRTIVALWSTDSPIPTLTGFHEVGAGEPLDAYLESAIDVTVAIHGSNFSLHTYPIEDDEDFQERRTFEIATCLPNNVGSADTFHDFSMPGLLHKTQWHGVAAIESKLTEAISRRTKAIVKVKTDIEMDIVVAISTIPPQKKAWVLIGIRGETWFRALIGSDHVLQHLGIVVPDARASYGTIVRDSILELRAATGIFIEFALVYGDHLTKSRYDEVAKALENHNVAIGRLQPFGLVKTDLDQHSRVAILSKAHLLGPLVGPLKPDLASGGG